jgi:protoporphyrin/coproporphyrin ferrochelatase
MMKTAVLLLNFGEPENPVAEEVVPFLERIFSLNASLMGPATAEQVAARSRKLAEERAPGLIEEYRAIGGSPLAAQARAQAEGVEAELRRRGHDVVARVAYQFIRPSIAEAVAGARAEGAERVVALPVYPLAGPSTTVAALVGVAEEMARQGWDAPCFEISGWHRHPGYLALRADAVRRVLERDGVSLDDPGTRLVFSAHGTPIKYLEEGSRYDVYVRDFCASLAAELGAPDYLLGYQNHTNRPGVEWTQPDIGKVIEETDAKTVVVDAVSFMHEQSETLAELDHELREEAEGRGIAFHRIPIPHDVPEFFAVMADMVEGALAGEGRGCRCRGSSSTYCLNFAAFD